MPFEELVARKASFLLTISGTEPTTMHTVFFSQRYSVADGEVANGGRYKDVFEGHRSGLLLNLAHLDDVVPDAEGEGDRKGRSGRRNDRRTSRA